MAGGTDFRLIFDAADQEYDRVIILSDMQAWVGYYSPEDNLKQYRKRTGADPFIFCLDLQGQGTSQFPQKKIMQLFGWSEKILTFMSLYEQGTKALISEINSVEGF